MPRNEADEKKAPRVVRNSWVSGTVDDGTDDREWPIKGTGPEGEQGGMTVRVYYREKGQVCVTPVVVKQRIVGGKLVINVTHDGTTLLDKVVTR